MSLSEEIKLLDSLLDSNTEIESPAWHEEILRERAKLYKEGHVKTYTLDEIKAKRPIQQSHYLADRD